MSRSDGNKILFCGGVRRTWTMSTVDAWERCHLSIMTTQTRHPEL